MVFSVPHSKQGHFNKSQLWYGPKEKCYIFRCICIPSSEHKIYVIKDVSLFAFDIRKSQTKIAVQVWSSVLVLFQSEGFLYFQMSPHVQHFNV